jgi:hypothetical protein
METLYDLLGALPRDDAEGLRTAFRQAVKGSHPDLNPGDPEAAKKFRQILRAQEILLDSEQRAAYDHLLELARVEEVEQARVGKIHKAASWIMAVAGLSAVSIGSLALAAQLWTATETAAGTDLVDARSVDTSPVDTSPGPTKIATVADPAPDPVAPTETKETAPPPLGPPLDITPPPGTVELDHLHGFGRASDISHAKRPEKIVIHSPSAKKKGLGTADTSARPVPPRRTAEEIDPSRLPYNPDLTAPSGQRF